MATPRKPKATEQEGFVTGAELADWFDTSKQWISELTTSGVITRHDTPAGPRYNLRESTRAYIEHLRKRAAGRIGDAEDLELERNRRRADAELKEARATILKIEAEELKGNMHRSEDVAALTEDLIYTIRSALIALPGRVAVDVAAVNTAAEASEVIRKEVYKVMRELADYQYDPKKYEERVRERQKWASAGEDAP